MRELLVLAALWCVCGLDGASARTSGQSRQWAPDVIVIHAVGGPICAGGLVVFDEIPSREDDAMFWRHEIENNPVIGIHYVIGRNGDVETSIPTSEVANHTVGFNARAIGIELVDRGDGEDPFNAKQIDALVELLRSLRAQYGIRVQNIVTHGDLDQRTCVCAGAPYRRRVDPGANFPIEEIRRRIALPGDVLGGQTLIPLMGPAPESACATR